MALRVLLFVLSSQTDNVSSFVNLTDIDSIMSSWLFSSSLMSSQTLRCSCNVRQASSVEEAIVLLRIGSKNSKRSNSNQMGEVSSFQSVSLATEDGKLGDTTEKHSSNVFVDLIVLQTSQDGSDDNRSERATAEVMSMFKISSRYHPDVFRAVAIHSSFANTEETLLLKHNFLNKSRADVVVEVDEHARDMAFEALKRSIGLYFCSENSSSRNQSDITQADLTNIASFSLFPYSLQRIHSREQTLRELSLGITTYRIQQLLTWMSSLQRQMQTINDEISLFRRLVKKEAIQKPLTTHNTRETTGIISNTNKNGTIRIVHVSDTHNQHRWLTYASQRLLPAGDLFIHSGDIAANYDHHTNLVLQFRDFLSWLHTDVCPFYEQVVFIAGNHDVYLDKNPNRPGYDNDARSIAQASSLLSEFLSCHPNVAYLQNSILQYKGLTIYGVTAIPCRMELEQKWYLSNGFEYTQAERIDLWKNQYPGSTSARGGGGGELIDVLITHCPPENTIGAIVSKGKDGCPVMTEHVYNCGNSSRRITDTSRCRPPLLHCYGHVHGLYGVSLFRHDSSETIAKSPFFGTILSNASQPCLLHNTDPCMGGLPLVIDLPIPSTN